MNLKTWLQQQGAQMHPAIRLAAPLPSGDRAVLVTAEVLEGQQLMRIPLSACLHMPPKGSQPMAAYHEAAQHLHSLRQSQQPPLTPFLEMLLLLLHEEGKV